MPTIEVIQYAAIGIGAVFMAYAVYKAVRVLMRGRRSSADNNWTNEAFAARQEAKTWEHDG